jgi:tRNA A37 threonylcarbamoyltransferase TsaD
MWMLAVDTTTKNASVALARDPSPGCAGLGTGAEVVALVAPRSDEQHSVQLFRNIEQAIGEAGVTLRDLDVYAVANGPGAFTALRIGLTVVKGWPRCTQAGRSGQRPRGCLRERPRPRPAHPYRQRLPRSNFRRCLREKGG